jgi:hypothetical protein
MALIACTVAASACTEEMKWKDSGVTAPDILTAPKEGESVVLEASATAATVFQWGSSHAEDGGAPMYDVVFDKVGGDFSNPLFKVASDLNGSLNSATISHKILNQIAGLAGAASGESVDLQWTVFAYRGLSKAQATESRKLTLTRFYGFDVLPSSLYIIDSAEEGGIACASPAGGMFEVYVKLDAGKGFTLNSAADGSGTSYCISGDNKIIEGDTGYKVEKSGIYCLSFDFTVASFTGIKQINKVYFYFCPTNKDEIELPYAGNGVFQGQGVVKFKQESWGRDQRYKFRMYYADGSKQVWGTKNNTDSAPNGAALTDPYYYILGTADNQWDQKWKLDSKFDGDTTGANPGAVTKFSLVFNVANYTHRVELAN